LLKYKENQTSKLKGEFALNLALITTT